MLSCIIIDDLALARENLKADLADHCPDIEIKGEAEGVVTGIKLLKKVKPDFIFLDIEMQDGDGFDLLEILESDDIKVVFVTASKDFAIKAFQYVAVDYLLKPVDPELLVNAVRKVKQALQDLSSVVTEQPQSSDKISLSTAEELRVVSIKDIVRCESMGNYTQVYFTDGGKLLVTKTLKDFDRRLGPEGFLRVHQSHLINQSYIKSFVKTEGGYILMKDDSQISVSVRKRAEVLAAIEYGL